MEDYGRIIEFYASVEEAFSTSDFVQLHAKFLSEPLRELLFGATVIGLERQEN